VDPEILIAAFRLVETLLDDCAGLAEFTAKLVARRDGYVLELMRAATVPDGTAAARAEDIDALRTWLRSLGAAWLESAQGERSIIELRIPRQAVSPKNETPAG
jgi:hypothetical protein